MDSVVRRPALVAALLAAALVAWIVTAQRMRGMDAGPGTDLGAFGWFMGIWVTMMAAMMLPSAVPAVAMFAAFGPVRRPGRSSSAICWRGRPSASLPTAPTAGCASSRRRSLPGTSAGAWVAGGALIVAGVYQLTPLKTACLRHCRAPLGFLLRGGPGRAGAFGPGSATARTASAAARA